MNTKKQSNQKEGGDSTQQAFMAVSLVLCAVFWKFESEIRLWFYQNLMLMVLAGLGCLALSSAFLWYRFKKKEKEYFEKRRILREVKPQFSDEDYYKPKQRGF